MELYPQHNRPWKFISYVSRRTAIEAKLDEQMLNIDDEQESSRAAFRRVCEHINYNHPSKRRRMPE